MHYQRLMNTGTTDKLERPKKPIPHGTVQGYGFHKCRCDECRAAYYASTRRWRDRNRERLHEQHLLAFYGMTKQEYDSILESQGGVCAICGEFRCDSRRRFMDVDHDHETGEVRSILCHVCNRVVGKVEIRAKVWEKELRYLGWEKKHAD